MNKQNYYIFLMRTICWIIIRSSSGNPVLFGVHDFSQKNKFTIIRLPSVWHSMPFTRMTDKLEQIGSMFACKFSMNTALFIFASNSNVFKAFCDICGWHSIFGNFDSHEVNVSFLWNEAKSSNFKVEMNLCSWFRLTDNKRLASSQCRTASWIFSKQFL